MDDWLTEETVAWLENQSSFPWRVWRSEITRRWWAVQGTKGVVTMGNVWDFRDRFPLQPPGGVELPHEEPSHVRPFGIRYAVAPREMNSAEMGKHEKPTGTKPVTKPTEYTNDSERIKNETTYTVRD